MSLWKRYSFKRRKAAQELISKHKKKNSTMAKSIILWEERHQEADPGYTCTQQLPVFFFLPDVSFSALCPFCSSSPSSSCFLFLSFFFFLPNCSSSGSWATVFSAPFAAFPFFCWRASLRSRLFSFFFFSSTSGWTFWFSFPLVSTFTSATVCLASLVSWGGSGACKMAIGWQGMSGILKKSKKRGKLLTEFITARREKEDLCWHKLTYIHREAVKQNICVTFQQSNLHCQPHLWCPTLHHEDWCLIF